MSPDRSRFVAVTAGVTFALAVILSSSAAFLIAGESQVVLRPWLRPAPADDGGGDGGAEEAGAPEALVLVTHRVQPGDNLWTISRRYGSTPDTIQSANPDLWKRPGQEGGLRPGQEIQVPNRKGVYHRISTGQTLSDLSQAYGVAVDSILETNGIQDPRKIRAGQRLFLPGADPLSATDPRAKALESRIIDVMFAYPVQGRRITGYFGMRTNPISGGREYHKGLDLAARWGSDVRAAQEGDVIFAGWRPGYGRCVILQHRSNLQSWYGHNTEVLVRAGERVRKGDRIALVGNTGDSTGPHCHFEIRVGGKPVSPLRYLAR